MLEPEKRGKFYCQQTLSMSSQSNFTFCKLRSLGSASVESALKQALSQAHKSRSSLTQYQNREYKVHFPDIYLAANTVLKEQLNIAFHLLLQASKGSVAHRPGQTKQQVADSLN